MLDSMHNGVKKLLRARAGVCGTRRKILQSMTHCANNLSRFFHPVLRVFDNRWVFYLCFTCIRSRMKNKTRPTISCRKFCSRDCRDFKDTTLALHLIFTIQRKLCKKAWCASWSGLLKDFKQPWRRCANSKILANACKVRKRSFHDCQKLGWSNIFFKFSRWLFYWVPLLLA